MKTVFVLLFSAALCYAENVKQGEFPYFALCQGTAEKYCAGIILTEELVLLPGKCTKKLGADDEVLVTVGEVEINDETKSHKAKLIEVAEEYRNDARAKDIAFLAVSEEFEFNSNIKPAKQIHQFKSLDEELKIVGFNTDQMKYFKTNSSFTCQSALYNENKGYEYTWNGVCVGRYSGEDKPDLGFLLASENGDVYGLPYYFTAKGPDLFLGVNNYLDIINATISDYENNK